MKNADVFKKAGGLSSLVKKLFGFIIDIYSRFRAAALVVFTTAERTYNDNVKDTLLGARCPQKW